MPIVLLLFPFLACDVQIMTAYGDDVVTTVGGGVVDGFVLAHEGEGDGGSNAAEGAWVSAHVDEVPCAAVGKPGLERLLE